MCKLVSNYVIGQPALGPLKVVTKCETHSFTVDDPVSAHGGLCPIGRIEKAIEEGLDKIAIAAGKRFEEGLDRIAAAAEPG